MGATASRPSWKGSITFGLVTVPIRLHVAVDERTVRFHQLHDACGSRIRQKKVCEGCGVDVGMDEIVKGFELDRETCVRVTDEDFEALPVATKKVVNVFQFVDPEEIDPVLFTGKTYYVQPEEAGARGYALMKQAMLGAHKAGLARFAFRESRERLALVRPRSDTLVLEMMFWPDEVRALSAPEFDVKVTRPELTVAKQLVENMTAEFDPAAHHDTYREMLVERIEAKAAGIEVPAAAPAPKKTAAVVDLMETLRASVAATKAAKGREIVAEKKARRKTA